MCVGLLAKVPKHAVDVGERIRDKKRHPVLERVLRLFSLHSLLGIRLDLLVRPFSIASVVALERSLECGAALDRLAQTW